MIAFCMNAFAGKERRKNHIVPENQNTGGRWVFIFWEYAPPIQGTLRYKNKLFMGHMAF